MEKTLNRSEMITAVERLFDAGCTEEELRKLFDQLDGAAPGSGISDLIYYPDEDRTAEQVVDTALARSVAGITRLPPPWVCKRVVPQ